MVVDLKYCLTCNQCDVAIWQLGVFGVIHVLLRLHFLTYKGETISCCCSHTGKAPTNKGQGQGYQLSQNNFTHSVKINYIDFMNNTYQYQHLWWVWIYKYFIFKLFLWVGSTPNTCMTLYNVSVWDGKMIVLHDVFDIIFTNW